MPWELCPGRTLPTNANVITVHLLQIDLQIMSLARAPLRDTHRTISLHSARPTSSRCSLRGANRQVVEPIGAGSWRQSALGPHDGHHFPSAMMFSAIAKRASDPHRAAAYPHSLSHSIVWAQPLLCGKVRFFAPVNSMGTSTSAVWAQAGSEFHTPRSVNNSNFRERPRWATRGGTAWSPTRSPTLGRR
jgi:hypothetical protein